LQSEIQNFLWGFLVANSAIRRFGNPPKADYCLITNQTVVLSNCRGNPVGNPNKLIAALITAGLSQQSSRQSEKADYCLISARLPQQS
jgi:hypothetical protein